MLDAYSLAIASFRDLQFNGCCCAACGWYWLLCWYVCQSVLSILCGIIMLNKQTSKWKWKCIKIIWNSVEKICRMKFNNSPMQTIPVCKKPFGMKPLGARSSKNENQRKIPWKSWGHWTWTYTMQNIRYFLFCSDASVRPIFLFSTFKTHSFETYFRYKYKQFFVKNLNAENRICLVHKDTIVSTNPIPNILIFGRMNTPGWVENGF